MPRILPRLIKLPLSSGHYPFPQRPSSRSLRKPVPPLPSVLLEDYPRSVLLSPGNIITNSHDYVRHKSAAPVQPFRRRRVAQDRANPNEYEPPREMTTQERIWWSSPYLRMLTSPLRQCLVSDRYLPMDFLIRLVSMRVPQDNQGRTKHPLVAFPDGLQHPRFNNRKAGHGRYILCSRASLAVLLKRGKYKRYGAEPQLLLGEQIAHLLRLRVLQELQLLVQQLKALYRARAGAAPPRPPVLRRLTRAEWSTLATTGAVPELGALAVLVVPPVNRDPTTKQRPPAAGAMSASRAEDPSHPRAPPKPKRQSLPMSVLHSACAPPAPKSSIYELQWSTDAYWEEKRRERAAVERAATERGTTSAPLLASLAASQAPEKNDSLETRVPPHAEERVPLYNGVPLFPGRVQRAKLHTLLTRILGVEGAWRFSARSSSPPKGDQRAAAKGENKASHAFLIRASDDVDVAPLCVALWRLRMWEGGGFRPRSLDGARIKEEEPEPWPWVTKLGSNDCRTL